MAVGELRDSVADKDSELRAEIDVRVVFAKIGEKNGVFNFESSVVDNERAKGFCDVNFSLSDD